MPSKMKTKTRALYLPKEYAILRHPIPPPPGGIPIRPYPRWLRLVLESKLPIGLLPREEFIMTSRKLSHKLDRVRPQQDFDLSDPYLRYRPATEYNPLSDPHCAEYFSRPDIHRHLHKEGFITSDDRVIVNLKAFNQYRRYLYRLQLNEIKQYRRREYENTLYERAVQERRRIEEFWRSEEYASIQKRRSRCVDLCRLLRDMDEEERKRYLHYYTADVERKAEWKLEQLKNAVQASRLVGIERQLLDMKEIKERITSRKQLLLKEWMKKLQDHDEKHQDLQIIAEIERARKKREFGKRLRRFQEQQLPQEDEMRALDEEDRKQAVAQRKVLINIRRKNAYEEFMKLRDQTYWKRLPIQKTKFDKSTFRGSKEMTSRIAPYQSSWEIGAIKLERTRKPSMDESSISFEKETTEEPIAKEMELEEVTLTGELSDRTAEDGGSAYEGFSNESLEVEGRESSGPEGTTEEEITTEGFETQEESTFSEAEDTKTLEEIKPFDEGEAKSAEEEAKTSEEDETKLQETKVLSEEGEAKEYEELDAYEETEKREGEGTLEEQKREEDKA